MILLNIVIFSYIFVANMNFPNIHLANPSLIREEGKISVSFAVLDFLLIATQRSKQLLFHKRKKSLFSPQEITLVNKIHFSFL